MKTVRILSLDGGGIRGIFTNTFMKLFCQQADIPGNDVWKYFDIITGTSIGGISALGYANGLSPTDLVNLLVDNGPTIFDGPFGIGPAGTATFIYVLATPLIDPYIYYATPLQTLLEQVLGTTKMFQLKTNVLITSVMFNGGTAGNAPGINFPYGTINYAIPQQFSNVNLPFLQGQKYNCVDVGLATSAAPVYFPPAAISQTPNNYYLDGGLYQNNPAALAYAMSKVMFPGKNKTCILSVGTGITNVGFDIPTTTSLKDIKFGELPEEVQVKLIQEWKSEGFSEEEIMILKAGYKVAPQTSLDLFKNVLSMTIGGAQEAVDQQLKIQSLYNGAADNLYYLRFQTKYPKDEPAELDNVSDEFMTYLQTTAEEQYAIDQLKISAFIGNAGFNN